MSRHAAQRRVAYLSGAPRVSTRPDAPASGPRAHVLGTISGLRAQGWDVGLYIVGDRIFRPVGSGAEQRLHDSPLVRAVADIARLSLSRYQRWRAIRTLGTHFDFCYERFGAFQALGRSFQRRHIPWILETNGPFFREAVHERKSVLFQSLAKALELRAYREADVVVCVTSTLRDILTDQLGIEPGKIVVVPNGVDVDFFSPTHATPLRWTPEPTIGFVGTLTDWQSLDALIRAIHSVRSEGVRFSLTIVGDGLRRDAWQALSSSLGLGTSVRFTGRVSSDHVRDYIAGFDFGFSGHAPTVGRHSYHSPLKLYEYLAMGCPAIVSSASDASGVVQDGVNGFVYDPMVTGSLESALRRAWRALPSRSELSANARSGAVSNHSWAARMEVLLTDLGERFRWMKASD